MNSQLKIHFILLKKLFMRTIGLNIVQWNIDHYTIIGTLMIYLFQSIQQNILKRFYSYLNSPHLNISLTVENEKDNRMSFLDVNIICEKDKFTTSVYCKPTFSGIYTHFDSFLPSSNNRLVTYIIIQMFPDLLRLDYVSLRIG